MEHQGNIKNDQVGQPDSIEVSLGILSRLWGGGA